MQFLAEGGTGGLRCLGRGLKSLRFAGLRGEISALTRRQQTDDTEQQPSLAPPVRGHRRHGPLGEVQVLLADRGHRVHIGH